MPDGAARREAPRVFYGYVVVGAAFLTLFVTYGLYGTFGVFFKPLLAEFGWSRATISGAFSLSMIVHGLLGIAVGALNDRFGPRLVITACGVFLGAGHLLMALANSVWQLYLFYGVIVGIGMSGVWVPLMSTVARWFVRRRSLMTGIIVAGAGIGSLISPPLINWLIDAAGWRVAYLVLGAVILVVMVLAAQLLRRDPAQMGLEPHGEAGGQELSPQSHIDRRAFPLRDAARTGQFWLVFLILVCFGYGMVAVKVHIAVHVTDLGFSAANGALILALVGGIGILGNYLLGSLADRTSNRLVFTIGFVLTAAALLWLVPAQGLGALYAIAAVFGFAFGGMASSESPLVASLFGLRSHGLIYGAVGLGFTIGAAFGPLLTGYIYDTSGSYRTAFLLCAGVTVIGVIAALVLKPIKRPPAAKENHA